MDGVFVRERITSLRMKKGVSEYQMSYDLGHSRGYINNIFSGKSLPSVAELLSICEYFGITPAEFFDEGDKDPRISREIIELISRLDSSDRQLMKSIVERLLRE